MDGAMDADGVGRATLFALGRTRTTRPGWLSKVLEWSPTALPRTGRSRILQQVRRGMTTHQTRPPARAHGERQTP